MKNRSKMILSLASMLGVSAGAAAVSGFAWFTTTRTAKITASNFKVGASDGSLKISSVEGAFVNCVATSDENNVLAINPNEGELADVSSKDGKTFYKVLLDTEKKAVDSIVEEDDADAMSKVNTAQMVKVQWEVKVENTAPGTKLNVFLSNEGSIFSQNAEHSKTTQPFVGNGTKTTFELPIAFDKVESVKVNDVEKTLTTDYTVEGKNIVFKTAPADEAAIKVVTSIDYSDCYRLAVYDVAKTGPEDDKLVYLFSNGTKKNYVAQSDIDALTDGNDETVATRGAGELASSEFIPNNAKVEKTTDAAASTADGAKAYNQLLIENLIASTTTAPVTDNSHTLRFVVWCEGTSTPDEAVVAANGVDMALKLVALSVAA